MSFLRRLLSGIACFGWTMDLKVGARMLARYPVLTVVGSLALAFAIAVGAVIHEAVRRVVSPEVRLPGGDRIVGFKLLDRAGGEAIPASGYDFLAWRQQLTTVTEIGAFRTSPRNLVPPGGVAEPVTLTEISAAGFRVASVPARLGRTLTEADEATGAAPVVVLGHELWRSRFGANEAILGQVVRVGETSAAVVGVMPPGFRFPVDDQLWMPLGAAALSREPGRDPLKVFGRLAPGATLPAARAELLAVGARAAAAFPRFYEHVVPQVLPYPESIIPLTLNPGLRAGLYSINLLAALFLLVVCGNVALLMFARAATREKEILVRTALGATRARIVGMLFLEALVLALVALALGLGAAGLVLKRATEMLGAGPDRWPFWFDGGLSAGTVLYAGGLALLAAAVAGVVPGMKLMGRGLWNRLGQAGGGGGLRMGGIWTAAIVAQIAAMILFTAVAIVVQRQASHIASVETGFPAGQFLTARLEMDPVGADESAAPGGPRFLQRYTAVARELERRLLAEPSIRSVAVADQLPLMPGSIRGLEVEQAGDAGGSSEWGVRTATVGPGFFEAFRMPLLSGRGFDTRDVAEGATAVVVNDVFVEQVLQGRHAVGRRVRYSAPRPADPAQPRPPPGPWLEIVGVVRDLVPSGAAPLNLDNPVRPRVYLPLHTAVDGVPLYVALQPRTPGDALAPVLRRIAGEASPTLRLHDLMPLDEATSEDTRAWSAFAKVVLAGSGITLVLSLAGIYAVMSFTVSRRRREIGVRVALGGPAWRVILEIFRRPFHQVATGVALGCSLVAAMVVLAGGGSAGSLARHGPLLVAYGAVMVGVCSLACLGPILRALRVQPVEALRDDG